MIKILVLLAVVFNIAFGGECKRCFFESPGACNGAKEGAQGLADFAAAYPTYSLAGYKPCYWDSIIGRCREAGFGGTGHPARGLNTGQCRERTWEVEDCEDDECFRQPTETECNDNKRSDLCIWNPKNPNSGRTEDDSQDRCARCGFTNPGACNGAQDDLHPEYGFSYRPCFWDSNDGKCRQNAYNGDDHDDEDKCFDSVPDLQVTCNGVDPLVGEEFVCSDTYGRDAGWPKIKDEGDCATQTATYPLCQWKD